MEPNNDKGDGLSSMKVSQRPAPCIKTVSTKNKKWDIVIEDSLLKGTEGLCAVWTNFLGKSAAQV